MGSCRRRAGPDEDPGAGIETSLVADGGLLATLRLVDSVTTTTGVLAATYQPTRTNSGPEYPGPNENRTVADHSALLPQPRRRSGGRVTANDCMVLAALVQAEAVGDRGGLHPPGDAELGQDVGDVHAGGLGADEQRLGDLAVAAPGRHQRQHLGLARGEAQLLGRRRRTSGYGWGADVWGQVQAGTPRQGPYLGIQGAGAETAGDLGGGAQHHRGGLAVAGGQQRLGLAEAGVGGPVGLAQPLPGGNRRRPGSRVRLAGLPGPLGQPEGVPGGQLRDAGAGRAGDGLVEPLQQRGGGAIVGGR